MDRENMLTVLVVICVYGPASIFFYLYHDQMPPKKFVSLCVLIVGFSMGAFFYYASPSEKPVVVRTVGQPGPSIKSKIFAWFNEYVIGFVVFITFFLGLTSFLWMGGLL